MSETILDNDLNKREAAESAAVSIHLSSGGRCDE
jgi:hypothetical protein